MRSTLTQQDKDQIIKLRRLNYSYAAIGKATGRSKATIQAFIKRNSELFDTSEHDHAFQFEQGSTSTEIASGEGATPCSFVDPKKTASSTLVKATNIATAQRNRTTKRMVLRFAFSCA